MKQKIKSYLLVLADIALVNISLLAAYWLRFDGDFAGIPEEYGRNILFLAILATFVKLACFFIFRLYGSLWKYAGAHELVSIASAAFTGNALMLGFVALARTGMPKGFERLGIIFDMADAPRGIFAISFLIDMFLLGGIRLAYRVFRKVVRGELLRPRGCRRVLVVGGGDAGAIIIKEMKLNPGLKYMPAAIIDDDPAKAGKKLNGVPIAGGRGLIPAVVAKKRIDEIIIAIPSAGRKAINDIFAICSDTGCKVKILPSVTDLISGAVAIQKVRDVDIEDLLGREPVRLDCREVRAFLEGKAVLVTGGGGSIGAELCRQIAGYGPKRLVMLDNYENGLYDIQNELLRKHPGLDLVPVIGSVREKQRVDRVFAEHRPAVVFHAAAHKHVPLMEANPGEAVKNNVFGTMNVAECADKHGAGKFVLISTDKAVNPTNIMGATKRIAEMVVQAIGRHSATEFAAVRFGNVLGSNGSVIPLFKKQIEQGGPVTVTHPEVVRYFMTIPEAVQLVLQAGAMAEGGEVFVLDMGEPVRILDLARNLIKLSGFEPDVDIKIEFTGLRPGEKLYEELLTAEEGLRATRNDKIFVARPGFSDYESLKKEIERLKDIVLMNPDGLFEHIRGLVPTYRRASGGF